MCRPPSSGRIRRRACGLPHPASGWRSRPSVTLHVCVFTGAPRRRRRGRCPPFHAPTPATSTDCPAVSDGRGEAVIPRPVVRGPMAVALPPVALPPDGFQRATAGYVDRLHSADGMGSHHRPGTAPGLAGDHPYLPLRTPPAIQLRSPR